jgi:hypothetical protein
MTLVFDLLRHDVPHLEKWLQVFHAHIPLMDETPRMEIATPHDIDEACIDSLDDGALDLTKGCGYDLLPMQLS